MNARVCITVSPSPNGVMSSLELIDDCGITSASIHKVVGDNGHFTGIAFIWSGAIPGGVSSAFLRSEEAELLLAKILGPLDFSRPAPEASA